MGDGFLELGNCFITRNLSVVIQIPDNYLLGHMSPPDTVTTNDQNDDVIHVPLLTKTSWLQLARLR